MSQGNNPQSTSQCDNPLTATNIIASTSDEIVGITEQMETDQSVEDVTSPEVGLSSVSSANVGEPIEAVVTPVTNCTVKKWSSPADVIPLPKRQEAQKRKSKKQKSEIFTSSPFKDQLIATEEKKRQAEETRLKKLETKKKKLKFTSLKQCKGKRKIEQPSTSSDNISCPGCEEEFTEPPTDWIQCTECKEWWHQACSNYESGLNFICDYC